MTSEHNKSIKFQLSLITKSFYNRYAFTGLSREEFNNFASNCLHDAKYAENTSPKTILELYADILTERMNAYTKKQLEKREEELINNYLERIIPINAKWYEFIKRLSKADDFLESLGYNLSLEMATTLIERNQRLSSALDAIFTHDIKELTNGDIFLYAPITTIFIQAYCKKKGLDISEIEVNDYDDKSFFTKKTVRELGSKENSNVFKGCKSTMLHSKKLSQAKIKELITQARQGNEEARNLLIESNISLVSHMVQKYYAIGYDQDDLLQEGLIGLMRAIDKYDINSTNNFSTYVVWWVKSFITKTLRDNSRTIRLPADIHSKFYKFEETKRRYIKEYGHEPTIKEFAAILGVSDEEILKLNSYPHTISSNSPALENDFFEDDEDIEDLTPEDVDDIVDVLSRKNLPNEISDLFKKANVSPRQEFAIRLRYGFETGEIMALKDIAQIMGISDERARQIILAGFTRIIKCPDTEAFAIYMQRPTVALETIQALRKENSKKSTYVLQDSYDVYEDIRVNGPIVFPEIADHQPVKNYTAEELESLSDEELAEYYNSINELCSSITEEVIEQKRTLPKETKKGKVKVYGTRAIRKNKS